MKILILGGTAEARDLANRLVALGCDVTTSLAGRTREPILPEGAVRSGGFGGAAGLARYLTDHDFQRLVDATHPYAGQISHNAVAAAKAAGVPLVRYLRPPWQAPAGAEWLQADTPEAAADIPPAGSVVLLTTGHTANQAFFARHDCQLVLRMIEPPAEPVPAHAQLLLARPPYALDSELALMQAHRVTHLVSKNSGGGQTAAKLDAAKLLNIQVIILARPTYAPALEVTSIEKAISALELE
jgi:precorrin-6A/cobalt-precorrin-6A reductase